MVKWIRRWQWPFMLRRTHESRLFEQRRGLFDIYYRNLEEAEKNANKIVQRLTAVGIEPSCGSGRYAIRVEFDAHLMGGLLNGPMDETFWWYVGKMAGRNVEQQLASMDFSVVREARILPRRSIYARADETLEDVRGD